MGFGEVTDPSTRASPLHPRQRRLPAWEKGRGRIFKEKQKLGKARAGLAKVEMNKREHWRARLRRGRLRGGWMGSFRGSAISQNAWNRGCRCGRGRRDRPCGRLRRNRAS